MLLRRSDLKLGDTKLKYRVDFYNYIFEDEDWDSEEQTYTAIWKENNYLETQYFINKEAALNKCFHPLEERVRNIVIGKYIGPELIE